MALFSSLKVKKTSELREDSLKVEKLISATVIDTEFLIGYRVSNVCLHKTSSAVAEGPRDAPCYVKILLILGDMITQ